MKTFTITATVTTPNHMLEEDDVIGLLHHIVKSGQDDAEDTAQDQDMERAARTTARYAANLEIGFAGQEPPPEVRVALDHVRQYHPEVTQVFFGVDQRWVYCSDAFEAPEFNDSIDVSLLEAAADSVPMLPAAYSIVLEA
jgi:hypothetical protein